MPADQKRIYYLGGPELAAIKKSPNLEIFRRRGIEVLFLSDPIDEFVMSALQKFDDKPPHLDRLGRTRTARHRYRDAREASGGSRLGVRPRTRVVPQGARRSRAAGPRVEAPHRQSLLPGQCRRGHQHPDAASAQAEQPRVPRNRADPRGQPLGPTDQTAGAAQCQSRPRRLHRAVRPSAPQQCPVAGRPLSEPEALVARIQQFMEEAAEKRSPLVL